MLTPSPQIIAALILVLGMMFGIMWVLTRNDNRYLVTGRRGRHIERRRLKVQSDGCVVWLDKSGKEPLRLKLEPDFALQGSKGMEYEADLELGCLVRHQSEGVPLKQNALTYARLMVGNIFKQMGDSAKTDLTQILGRAVIVGGLVAMALVIGVVAILYKVY